ncbi:glycosyltransferase family 4 protein [Natrialba asiatica]|uniref:Glycosyltransferase n=1 Tax=Natrialba asiatica (strain ATCC 700177 / DSM 12278 / JCM 9576 / FERM P-10747 / NBRC 102637 / 172P1) TaxID=29540 RepID=M0B5F2_NATA1|nr:glycosyltransferase family 4 protein [Natrialba asiatica]ELZ06010.1 glycosyltransferase [Natrialba asiatica DSM 12278]
MSTATAQSRRVQTNDELSDAKTETETGAETGTETESTSALVISQLFPPESMAGAHRWEMLLRNVPDSVESRVICPQPSVPVGEFDRRYSLWSNERVGDVPVTRLFTYQPVEDRTNVERILNHVIFAVLATVYVLVHGRKYDCVVVQIGPHTTLVPGLAALATGRGLVVDVYDRWLENAVDFGFTDERSLAYRLLRWMERIAIERCDRLIALTPTMASQYVAEYDIDEDRIETVPFGVDDDLFDPSVATDEEPRIIYTGKLGEGQAFEPFLRGFRRAEIDHELVVYGFGERRDELEALASRLGIDDRVRINGPIPREEIPALVASSAISLVPLQTEHALDYARPTKFLETMALGTPYVASAVAEIESVTEATDAGLAVENDPDAVAAALRDLASDPDRRRAMGERGIAFVDRHHRWDELGDRVGDLFSAIARDRERAAESGLRARIARITAAVGSRP